MGRHKMEAFMVAYMEEPTEEGKAIKDHNVCSDCSFSFSVGHPEKFPPGTLMSSQSVAPQMFLCL